MEEEDIIVKNFNESLSFSEDLMLMLEITKAITTYPTMEVPELASYCEVSIEKILRFMIPRMRNFPISYDNFIKKKEFMDLRYISRMTRSEYVVQIYNAFKLTSLPSWFAIEHKYEGSFHVVPESAVAKMMYNGDFIMQAKHYFFVNSLNCYERAVLSMHKMRRALNLDDVLTVTENIALDKILSGVPGWIIRDMNKNTYQQMIRQVYNKVMDHVVEEEDPVEQVGSEISPDWHEITMTVVDVEPEKITMDELEEVSFIFDWPSDYAPKTNIVAISNDNVYLKDGSKVELKQTMNAVPREAEDFFEEGDIEKKYEKILVPHKFDRDETSSFFLPYEALYSIMSQMTMFERYRIRGVSKQFYNMVIDIPYNVRPYFSLEMFTLKYREKKASNKEERDLINKVLFPRGIAPSVYHTMKHCLMDSILETTVPFECFINQSGVDHRLNSILLIIGIFKFLGTRKRVREKYFYWVRYIASFLHRQRKMVKLVMEFYRTHTMPSFHIDNRLNFFVKGDYVICCCDDFYSKIIEEYDLHFIDKIDFDHSSNMFDDLQYDSMGENNNDLPRYYPERVLSCFGDDLQELVRDFDFYSQREWDQLQEEDRL